jgi:hypothetical protein
MKIFEAFMDLVTAERYTRNKGKIRVRSTNKFCSLNATAGGTHIFHLVLRGKLYIRRIGNNRIMNKITNLEDPRFGV